MLIIVRTESQRMLFIAFYANMEMIAWWLLEWTIEVIKLYALIWFRPCWDVTAVIFLILCKMNTSQSSESTSAHERLGLFPFLGEIIYHNLISFLWLACCHLQIFHVFQQFFWFGCVGRQIDRCINNACISPSFNICDFFVLFFRQFPTPNWPSWSFALVVKMS